jgi:hypothetical protein
MKLHDGQLRLVNYSKRVGFFFCKKKDDELRTRGEKRRRKEAHDGWAWSS